MRDRIASRRYERHRTRGARQLRPR